MNSGLISPPAVAGSYPSERPHAPPLQRRQELDDPLAALLVELTQEIHGVVGLHPGQHRHDLAIGPFGR